MTRFKSDRREFMRLLGVGGVVFASGLPGARAFGAARGKTAGGAADFFFVQLSVQSSDQHTVKPWFNGKVPFGVPVADFAAAGFPLVGGRLDYVGGREVAALVYRRRSHFINAFVWPAASAAAASERSARGYSVRRWARGGLAWWLVSDAGAADLRALDELLAEAR